MRVAAVQESLVTVAVQEVWRDLPAGRRDNSPTPISVGKVKRGLESPADHTCGCGGTPVAILLAAAGVQGADAEVGLISGNHGAAVVASTAAAVHLACAVALR